ncbi:hypothetical protein RZS08_34730, partial [Arthrospira platensis SPKY1]|nr:hypothetical protein [Arthrospira platensis SPKY1]
MIRRRRRKRQFVPEPVDPSSPGGSEFVRRAVGEDNLSLAVHHKDGVGRGAEHLFEQTALPLELGADSDQFILGFLAPGD